MGILVNFKTGKEIEQEPFTIEDEFMQDLMFTLSSATSEDVIKECIFSKYEITIKNN